MDHTLKTTRHYNVATMRKLRDKIISALKEVDIILNKTYSLSSSNEISAHFQLNLKTRSLTEQAATTQEGIIRKKLLTVFSEIEINFIGVKSDGLLRLDLEKEYSKLHPVLTENEKAEDVVLNEKVVTNYELPTEQIRFSQAEINRQTQAKKESRIKPNPRGIKERPILPLTEDMLNYKIVDLKLREILKLCKQCSFSENGLYDLYYVTADVMEKYFSHIYENRDLIEPHIESIEDSYVTYDYLYTEAIVNEKLQIIDAQHRIEVAIRNNLGMYFKIRVGWGMDEVTLYNVNNRNWNDIEYLNSYSKKGLPAYVAFKKFYDANEFDFSTCEVLFKGHRLKKSGKASEDDFKNKRLEISEVDINRAETTAKLIIEFKELHPAAWKSRNFVEAIILLSNSPKYRQSEMIKKLKNIGEESKLKTAKNSWRISEYFVFLAKLFNKGKHDDAEIIPIPSRFLEEVM